MSSTQATHYLPLMAGDGMSFMLFLVAVAVLYVTVRLLFLASPASAPTLVYRKSAFNEKVVNACPLLSEPYVPPLLWGKSGHLQTMVYGKLGRVKSPFLQGERMSVLMPDGATMTYDVFEPLRQHPFGDFTLLICPGIANSSESLYVCTCVDYAQNHGFRVVVLNHLGALHDVRLTAPRIFTYGGTEEYGAMVEEVRQRYPNTKMIACGFSMGGNIITKYLGENNNNQDKFIAGISCCQGYDAELGQQEVMSWTQCRRAYCFVMTLHQKKLMRAHYNEMFGAECERRYGKFDLKRLFEATSLVEIDEVYSRRRAGFDSLEEYYRSCSSKNVIDNISIPMFFLNARDDPLISNKLLDTPTNFAESRDNVIFAQTEHGGHLGFFEGGMTIPDTITWLDKIVVEYSNALITVTQSASETSGFSKASTSKSSTSRASLNSATC